ncbi:hypothetical protein H072_1317 [Dactylellina haptotyla CBS 200.50]|uniref:Uncharacterized protein n=1 Tax=Dactylellina haptotyla (strain CBS 200.50) TaxID=1284197 RepID=S8AP05_DACHA|nr:hypothetical protein H072_1317 [Dactylellina haptotyla CBS 200.50]
MSQNITRWAVSGKTLPGAPRPQLSFSNIGPPLSPISINSDPDATIEDPNLITTDNDDDDDFFDTSLSYRPRYHHNPGAPPRSLQDYFYALDLEGDDCQSSKDDETQESEYFTAPTEQDNRSVASHPRSRRGRLLTVTFHRHDMYQRELRKLGLQSANDYKVLADGIRLDIKFPELQILANDVWSKIRSAIVLHKDLANGSVSFSRWSVEGVCPDMDIFNMLMSFGALRRECQKKEQQKRAGTLLFPRKLMATTEIVKHSIFTEKRIKTDRFNEQVFKLPVRMYPEKLNPGENYKVGVSPYGNVAIRYNFGTGKFTFSGHYHKIELEGKNLATVDWYASQIRSHKAKRLYKASSNESFVDKISVKSYRQRRDLSVHQENVSNPN